MRLYVSPEVKNQLGVTQNPAFLISTNNFKFTNNIVKFF